MVTRLFVLLSTVGLLSAHQINVLNGENLQRSGITGRIYGGEDTPIESTPYQVSLQFKYQQHFCGGSIYSTYIIVTAAHCVENTNVKRIYVRVGSQNHDEGGSLIRVAKKSIHEQYSNTILCNDVAVLLLSSPLKLSAHIQTIPLAKTVPQDGAISKVSGWGQTETELVPAHLQSVDVQIVSRELCVQAYDHSLITKTTICAAAANKDACQGDSGGPLVHNGRLIGIVSWGYGCALPDYPGVYANVAVLRDWIVKAATKLRSDA